MGWWPAAPLGDAALVAVASAALTPRAKAPPEGVSLPAPVVMAALPAEPPSSASFFTVALASPTETSAASPPPRLLPLPATMPSSPALAPAPLAVLLAVAVAPPPVSMVSASPPTVLSPSDRKSVVKGKRVSVRVDLGGRRILKKKEKRQHKNNPT